MARPRPVPPRSRAVVKNGRRCAPRCAGETPAPSSVTREASPAPSSSVRRRRRALGAGPAVLADVVEQVAEHRVAAAPGAIAHRAPVARPVDRDRQAALAARGGEPAARSRATAGRLVRAGRSTSARASSSRRRTSRSRRPTSSSRLARKRSRSAGDISSRWSRSSSTVPRIAVSGVLNSCDTSAAKAGDVVGAALQRLRHAGERVGQLRDLARAGPAQRRDARRASPAATRPACGTSASHRPADGDGGEEATSTTRRPARGAGPMQVVALAVERLRDRHAACATGPPRRARGPPRSPARRRRRARALLRLIELSDGVGLLRRAARAAGSRPSSPASARRTSSPGPQRQAVLLARGGDHRAAEVDDADAGERRALRLRAAPAAAPRRRRPRPARAARRAAGRRWAAAGPGRPPGRAPPGAAATARRRAARRPAGRRPASPRARLRPPRPARRRGRRRRPWRPARSAPTRSAAAARSRRGAGVQMPPSGRPSRTRLTTSRIVRSRGRRTSAHASL